MFLNFTTMDTLTDKHLLHVTLADHPAAFERLGNTLRRRARGSVETTALSGCAVGEVQVLVVVQEEEARFVKAQVDKLVDVLAVETLAPGSYLGVQLALLRIEAAGADQDEASDELARAGAKLLRIGPTNLVAQVADTPETLDGVLARLKRWGGVTVIRSGLVAIQV